MRLAISGASNCGKTTLAEGLAKALGLEVIPEFLGAREPGPNLQPPEEMRRFNTILQAKTAREAELPDGFVSDRSPIDLAYSWLIRGLPRHFPDESREFFANCKRRSHCYEAVIFPPGPSPELGHTNYFGKAERIWEMWRNHCAMIGLALQWLPADKMLVVPSHMKTPEQRVEWVLDACAAHL